MDEERLAGGLGKAGRVTRVGKRVVRPANSHTRSIHAFLSFLGAAGFEGAPTPVGIRDDDREVLGFIEGDVAVPPYPLWGQSDDLLASVARQMRRLHDASRGFDQRGTWSDDLADPQGGPVMCHNDVCLENVVVRDGVAVALLDFDFAAPGRPVHDLLNFARMCVPIDDEEHATKLGWEPADRPARLRLVGDAYGLERSGRRDLIEGMSASMAQGADFVRRRVHGGDLAFTKIWNETGGMRRFERQERWWNEHQARFSEALLG